MKRKFSLEHPAPFRTEPRERNAFVIRVIREIRGFAAFLLLTIVSSALAEVHYVDVNSTNATPPYTNWTTAAPNIQDAVNAAVAGDEIVVTNGIYATGGRTIDGVTTNRVAVDKPLTLRSINGPQFTIIDGGRSVRCVYLTNGVSLFGFTLTNGSADFRRGGGIWCESAAAVVSNCAVAGNSAHSGGGAYGGTLNQCTLSGNKAGSGNSGYGGGAYGCTLNNCTLSGNSAVGRIQLSFGGGAIFSTLNNCTLTGNSAFDEGGAVYSSTLNNCTLSGNGGGAADSTLNNCIVYFNDVWDCPCNYIYSTLNYCCTTPQPINGVGNITNAPLFVDQASGNLRLQSNSPCINAGLNALAPAGLDLDGNPRISGGTVDIGAYEFVFTPEMNLGRLILLVEAADLGAKHRQPLLATLNAALASLTRGNATAANHQLLAFQNQLRAQVAPWNPALAEQWSAAAQQMIAAANGR